MKVKIHTSGRNGYIATGVFEDGNVTVLKNSIISSKEGNSLQKSIRAKRADKKIVSEEYVVKHDISFKSASLAAAFVSGNVSNGMRTWKTEANDELGNLVEGKKTKPRKE